MGLHIAHAQVLFSLVVIVPSLSTVTVNCMNLCYAVVVHCLLLIDDLGFHFAYIRLKCCDMFINFWTFHRLSAYVLLIWRLHKFYNDFGLTDKTRDKKPFLNSCTISWISSTVVQLMAVFKLLTHSFSLPGTLVHVFQTNCIIFQLCRFPELS